MKTILYILGAISLVIIIYIIYKKFIWKAPPTSAEALNQFVNSGQNYVPPTPPPGVVVTISPLDQFMLTGMPFAENPQILTGTAPIKFSSNFNDIHFGAILKFDKTLGLNELPVFDGLGAAFNPFGGSSNAFNMDNLAPENLSSPPVYQGSTTPHDIDVEYMVSGVKIKDIIWKLDPSCAVTPGWIQLKSVAYISSSGQIFPTSFPNALTPFPVVNNQLTYIFSRSIYTNSGRLKYISKEQTQASINLS